MFSGFPNIAQLLSIRFFSESSIVASTVRKAFAERSGKAVKSRMARKAEMMATLSESEKAKFFLKNAKGTRDYGPQQMAVRKEVIRKIEGIFERYGAVTIDTPVFELRDVLMGKYGDEGSKLVYDLADQGGEICSLRYDLTVPFARYMAMNKNTPSLKRYQIGKVYRRDQPVMTKGRYREFIQCDYDIAGQYEPMVPDAECVTLVDEVLSSLDIGDFEIKLNHRQLLEGMFALSGIKNQDFKTVCSSVDKLDKQPWHEIKEELVKEKHIDESAVNRLADFVNLREANPALNNVELLDLISQLSSDKESGQVESHVQKAVSELKLLLEYADALGCSANRVCFDPSLARGLDYYTGVIYEAVVKDLSVPPQLSANGEVDAEEAAAASGPIGSVAAGGRYDKLVGMFLGNIESDKKKKKKNEDVDIPCVGVSFGIERLFTIMEWKHASCPSRTLPVDVYVASPQKKMLQHRMKLCTQLRKAGIRADYPYSKANPKMLDQMQHCERNQIPLAVIIGEDELKKGLVKLRCIRTRVEIDMKLEDVIETLKQQDMNLDLLVTSLSEQLNVQDTGNEN